MIIEILKTRINNLSAQETLNKIKTVIENDGVIHHSVVNASKIVEMQKNHELRESVNESDIVNADGMAVVWASKFLGKPIKERVTGIDLMDQIVRLAYKNRYRIFFLGGREPIVKKVVNHYSNLYSEEIIAGYRNGYFSAENDKKIALQIAKSDADILFVGISSPRKEKFLYQNRELLDGVNFFMGVGGSFDVIAGYVKRAPVWMQKIGLEWLYRFIQEPQRMWRRYLIGNTRFIFLVIKEKLKMS